jgi:hypothetical protein
VKRVPPWKLQRSLDFGGAPTWRGANALVTLDLALGLALAGCSTSGSDGTGGAGGESSQGGAGTTTATTSGEGGGGGATSSSTGVGAGLPCPDGVICIEEVPFRYEGDTSLEGTTLIDAYDCAPGTNEGGPEQIFRVRIPQNGFLSAFVTDGAGDDVDVHLLSDLDPAAPSGTSCIARGDLQASADVGEGYAWVVVDTWVNGAGTALSGPFTLDVGVVAVSEGPCAYDPRSIGRIGDEGSSIELPSTGAVALEAHLVTQAEPPPFPTSSTDGIAEHYALTADATGLVMMRQRGYAPIEGGASFYGAGVGDPANLPVIDEAWYVTMKWTPASRPPPGTRMILRKPDDRSRAVVVAAGYETGPSELTRLGGTTEEAHFYLGTAHDAELELGFASDPQLGLGPRRCTD